MQTRVESLVEKIVDMVLAIIISTCVMKWALPALGITEQSHWDTSFTLVIIFTVISLIRGYIVRRAFVQYEYYQIKKEWEEWE